MRDSCPRYRAVTHMVLGESLTGLGGCYDCRGGGDGNGKVQGRGCYRGGEGRYINGNIPESPLLNMN